MGKVNGFIEYKREDPIKRPIEERIKDFKEFEIPVKEDSLKKQAARCMDCGVPHCHTYGCPTQNRIPDWNDLVYRSHWKQALQVLHSTDNFPEFTGRVCPAPCEAACTLAINQPAVSIRQIELAIIERGWEEGWVEPQPADFKSGKRVAVIGSGPAGLAVAQQLARKGHQVIVFERDDRIGGLLRYGIPDFKLEKWVIDRRLAQMKAEGVQFETNVDAGIDLSLKYMMNSFDAMAITAGSTIPRDLDVPGRDLDGVHFAMNFLTQQNRRIAGLAVNGEKELTAKGKRVIVLGGGDTGSDCVGTSKRQGAASIEQIELLPVPPKVRTPNNPWPVWPLVFRITSSHEEGCNRSFSILTKEFQGQNGQVNGLKVIKLEWTDADKYGRREFKEIPGSEFEIPADMILLAMGFIHMEHGPLVLDGNIKLDKRGNVCVDDNFMTSVPRIFAGGDSVMGASLVVRSLHQGRQMAEGIDRYLKNS
jgi:glutamate synthase (NADPH) small chain